MRRYTFAAFSNTQEDGFLQALLSVQKESHGRLEAIIKEAQTTNEIRRLEDLIAQVEREMQRVQARIEAEARGIAKGSYQVGMDLANGAARESGVTQTPLSINSVIHRQAVAVIAAQIAQDIIQANSNAANTVIRYLRATQMDRQLDTQMSRIVGSAIAAGESLPSTRDRILGAVKSRIESGNTVLVGGRAYNPVYYSELVARTRMREASTTGTLTQAQVFGMDLVQVSVHEHPQVDPCTPYQGKVFSISGRHPDFPKLEVAPPFHPNCKHVIVPLNESVLRERGEYERTKEISRSVPQSVLDKRTDIDAWLKSGGNRIESFEQFESLMGRR